MDNSKNSTTKKILPKIVFFGSGPVATASLEALTENFTIEAIITRPAPAGHHGAAPVKELAQAKALPCYTPATRTELDQLIRQHSFQSTCGVVVDYGIIISQQVIESFAKGIVNSHFSLLPEWRGADPITFAILSGQHTTGVSLMVIVPALDQGELFAQETFAIPPDMTTPQLTDSLIALSNKMLANALPDYLEGRLHPHPQSSDIPPTYSRKLTKDDGKIDWHKPAKVLEREVRAFIGWPGSRGVFSAREREFTAIITASAVGIAPPTPLKPGQSATIGTRLFIGTASVPLEILRLKIPGKKEITAAEFIRGYHL